tara:strand:+ start:59 stop:1495 length:1437 start_codon:yes stop_codon:yes gene_type:complete
MVGFWLIFQPEMALYGASTLRSPVFTCLGFMAMTLLIWGSRVRGFGLTALAFLVRMEAVASFYLPALWTWICGRGRSFRQLGLPLVMLGSVMVGWQAYISLIQERCLGLEYNLEDLNRCWETAFILGPLTQNLAPEVHGAQQSFDLSAWLQQGLQTSWALLTWTLPRKLSWTIVLAATVGALALLRGAARPGGKTVVVYAGFTLGVWLLEGFLAHHDPNHNLYWVWLLPAVPFLTLLAAAGWFAIDRRLVQAPKSLRAVVITAMLIGPLPSFAQEASYQMERAERWYRPQLELSRWMEEQLPAGTGVLVSSIPEVWLKRVDSKLRVYSWWLLPDEVRVSSEEELQRIPLDSELYARYQGHPEQIPWTQLPPDARQLKLDRVGNFLLKHSIQYVIWFEEDWTEAPQIAPFLGYRYSPTGELLENQQQQAGPVLLTPIDRSPPMRDQGYGWALYVATEPDDNERLVPPRFGSGEAGPGWQ